MPERAVCVLLTGGGAPGTAAAISMLRNNWSGWPVRIVATDMKPKVEGRYLADSFYLVPAPEKASYLDCLLAICDDEKVDVVFPQTTRETTVLAHNRHLFENGCVVAVSSPKAVEMATDKGQATADARRLRVPCPVSYCPKSWSELVDAAMALGYPERKVVVKPCVSHGMRGFRVLTEEVLGVERFLTEKPSGITMRMGELGRILATDQWPEMLVQEFLDGQEWSVDCFRGESGFVAVPRLRDEIRSGITMKATVSLRDDLIRWSATLAEAWDLRYCFGFQFKEDSEGVAKLLECNVRYQGSMITASFAGCNFVWATVLDALGEKIDTSRLSPMGGVQMCRYWGALSVVCGKAVDSVGGVCLETT